MANMAEHLQALSVAGRQYKTRAVRCKDECQLLPQALPLHTHEVRLREAGAAEMSRTGRTWEAPVTHTVLPLNALRGKRRVVSSPRSASALGQRPELRQHLFL